MKRSRNLALSLLIFVICVILYSYNLFQSYNFDNDFARDLIEIKKIVEGNLTFIGPAASIGIQTGPYYYYILAPIALITNTDVNSILFFNILLFAFSIAFIAYLSSIELGFIKAGLISLSIALLPMTIISARNPGNAFSYIPFLIILVTILATNKIYKRATLIMTGFLSGLIINFHYSNVLIVFSVLIYLLIYLKKKRELIYYFVSILITFFPLIFFEIKNSFVMIKNLFINNAYKNFVNNAQLSGSVPAKENIFENLFFMSNNAVQYISIHPVIIFLAGIATAFKKYFQKDSLLFLSSVFSFIMLVVILRSQYAYFYLFPFILFLVISANFLVIKSKYYFLILIFIFFELAAFPTGEYLVSWRHYSNFENAVNYVLENKLIISEKFNILQVRPDTIIAPYGNEYRFFFIKNGNPSLPVTEYNKAEQLLVFSEIKNFDIKNIKNNEMEEFGQNYKIKNYIYKNMSIYSLTK